MYRLLNLILPCSLMLFCASNGVDEQSMKDVYKIDYLQMSRFGDSKSSVSEYWIQIAKRELKQLKRKSFLGDEEAIAIRAKIEIALSPIERQADIVANLAPGKDRDAAVKELVSLYQDPAIAEQVFSALGTSRAIELATERTVSQIVAEAGTNRTTRTGLRNRLLKDKLFLDYLGVTPSQKSELDAILRKAENSVKNQMGIIREQSEILSSKRWQRLLSVLDPVQKEKAKKIIGPPVNWFGNSRMREDLAGLISDGAYQGGSYVSGDALNYASKIGRPLSDISEAELGEHGIVVGDPLLALFLKSKFLQDELGLSETQVSSFENLSKSFLSRTEANRVASLLKGNAQLPQPIVNILDEGLANRLRQVELQIRLGDESLETVGLSAPVVVCEFQIDDQTLERIMEIGQEFAQKLADLNAKLENTRTDSQVVFREKIADVLNSNQLEKLNRLVEFKADEVE